MENLLPTEIKYGFNLKEELITQKGIHFCADTKQTLDSLNIVNLTLVTKHIILNLTKLSEVYLYIRKIMFKNKDFTIRML